MQARFVLRIKLSFLFSHFLERQTHMKPISHLTLGALLVAAASGALAQAKAPEPDYTLGYNIGAVSDYRFRGITQSNYTPALQGGVDFSHKSGFYAGAWASNVSWVKQFNGATAGDYELDLYAGFKGTISGDLGFDVGVIGYIYPGNNSGAAGTPGAGTVTDANTTEVYGALTYKMFTLKYNQSTGNFLGFLNSSGSSYVDLSATFDLGNGFTLTPHVGRQTVKNGVNLDYTDYALTLTKDLGNGLSVTAALVGTDANQTTYVNSNGNTNYIGRNGGYLGLKFSF
ncbi:MAG: hypothetical protein RLZZ126_477 [Pseudomonadota bacterium]|jgi:uncharacterized protein (TIGR02001 family)